MKNKLTENKLGQHTAEFMVLFLALSVAFVGTRLYLSRGVKAKLKHVEYQLNKSIGGAQVGGGVLSQWGCGYVVETAQSYDACTFINNNGGTEDIDCGGGETTMPEANQEMLRCLAQRWMDAGCRVCMSSADFCSQLGICNMNPDCYHKRLQINVSVDGDVNELGVCVNRGCFSPSGNSVCPGSSDGIGPWYEGRCPACPGE